MATTSQTPVWKKDQDKFRDFSRILLATHPKSKQVTAFVNPLPRPNHLD
jgi:hypothetical protein